MVWDLTQVVRNYKLNNIMVFSPRRESLFQAELEWRQHEKVCV